MLDKTGAIIFIVLFILLATLGSCTTALSTISSWFSPARVVINGATPANVNVKFLYTFQLDGPINVIAIDRAGVRKVSNYSADGRLESGDNDYRDMSKEQELRITSRSTSQVHFTIRECRTRESWFQWVCD